MTSLWLNELTTLSPKEFSTTGSKSQPTENIRWEIQWVLFKGLISSYESSSAHSRPVLYKCLYQFEKLCRDGSLHSVLAGHTSELTIGYFKSTHRTFIGTKANDNLVYNADCLCPFLVGIMRWRHLFVKYENILDYNFQWLLQIFEFKFNFESMRRCNL